MCRWLFWAGAHRLWNRSLLRQASAAVHSTYELLTSFFPSILVGYRTDKRFPVRGTTREKQRISHPQQPYKYLSFRRHSTHLRRKANTRPNKRSAPSSYSPFTLLRIPQLRHKHTYRIWGGKRLKSARSLYVFCRRAGLAPKKTKRLTGYPAGRA